MTNDPTDQGTGGMPNTAEIVVTPADEATYGPTPEQRPATLREIAGPVAARNADHRQRALAAKALRIRARRRVTQ